MPALGKIIVLLILVVGLLSVLIVMPYLWDRKNDFWLALDRQFTDGATKVFVSDITTFEWTVVCVLPPYALNEVTDKAERLRTYIKGELGEFKDKLPNQDADGAWAFAFIKDGQVVAIEEKGRDFYLRDSYKDNCISRAQASFTREGNYVFIND